MMLMEIILIVIIQNEKKNESGLHIMITYKLHQRRTLKIESYESLFHIMITDKFGEIFLNELKMGNLLYIIKIEIFI
jgi:hypothetical protein